MTATDYSKYRLSIQFSLSGFSFVVFNAINSELIAEKEVVHSTNNSLVEWLKIKLASEPLFREDYQDITTYWLPDKYTTVPVSLYQEQKQEDIFKTVHPMGNEDLLQKEDRTDVVILYTVENSLYQVIKDYFPKGNWQTALLQEKISLNTDREWLVSLLISYQKVYITLKENGKLQLCNSYHFQTKDDLLYYVLYTFDNLDIPVAQSCILLNGHKPYIEMMLKELNNYHNTVRIVNNPYKIETKTPFGNFLLTI